MSRRRPNSPPVSLFAFQDIITATTGILILLALVMALAVIRQGAESAIQVEYADADKVAYRAGLVSEVESLRKLSTEIATESASWSSATPDELQKKSRDAAAAIERQKKSLANAQTTLAEQQQQLKGLQSESNADARKAELKKIADSIEQTNLQLNQLKSDNRIVYNFRSTNRTAWLVQISDREIRTAKVGSNEKPQIFTSPQSFNRFAVSVPQTEQYFVLLVAPSGIDNSDAIKAFLEQSNSEIGVDLIGENQIVIDPVKGAGF